MTLDQSSRLSRASCPSRDDRNPRVIVPVARHRLDFETSQKDERS